MVITLLWMVAWLIAIFLQTNAFPTFHGTLRPQDTYRFAVSPDTEDQNKPQGDGNRLPIVTVRPHLHLDPQESQIRGLLDQETFSRRNALHRTLMNLRSHLPQSLDTPLSPSLAVETYTGNVRLVLDRGPLESSQAEKETKADESVSLDTASGEILLSQGRDGLVALSLVLAATNTAAKRVSDVLSASSLFLNPSSSTRTDSSFNTINKRTIAAEVVSCDLAISQSLLSNHLKGTDINKIRIAWSVTTQAMLPLFLVTLMSSSNKETTKKSMSTSANQITGQSELTFDPQTGLVSMHRVLELNINGLDVLSVARVGESIAASMRQSMTVFLEGNKWVQSIVNAGSGRPASWNDIRDGIWQQVQQQSAQLVSSASKTDEKTGNNSIAPLFIAESLAAAFSNSTLTPIDEYYFHDTDSGGSFRFPFAGSKLWEEYAPSHECILQFYNDGINNLVSGESPTGEPFGGIQNLFDDNVVLATLDGSVLLRNDSTRPFNRIAALYQRLSSMRRATNGDWSLLSFAVSDWRTMTCEVFWICLLGSS